MKTVRVRLNRVLDPIDGARRPAGYETVMSAVLAEQWQKNGRITILNPTKAAARPDANKPDPTQAPPGGSPAGSGAQSSSLRPARQPRRPRSV